MIKFRTSRNRFVLLRNRRADLQKAIDATDRNLEVISDVAQSWKDKVDSFDNDELKKFLEEDVRVSPRCWNSRCPDLKSRYSLSRKAKKKFQDVVNLQQDGPKLDNKAYPASPSTVGSLFAKEDVKFNSRKSVMDQVLQVLKDDKLLVCGICGMGGVGKITMVKSIIQTDEENKLFDKVVMSVVSQNSEARRIQGELADSLSLKLGEESISGRARRLHQSIIASKTILIVLDDVWTELDFEEIGIPLIGQHKGCTVLMTSRDVDVCRRMKSQKIFQVHVLSEDEAWDLFKQMSGDSIQHSIAKEVAKECRGLPIAIVTTVKALEGKSKVVMWEDAIQLLRNSASTSYSEMEFVFSSIKLSYDFLKDEEAKFCFFALLFVSGRFRHSN